MKPSHVLKEYAGRPLDDLPEELQDLLSRKPELKKEFEDQAAMADLMALKRYEQPEEAMFGRVHHRAHIQILNAQATASRPLLTQLPGWARVTAVMVFMLGLSVLTHREMLRTEEGDLPVAVSTEPDPAASEVPFFTMGEDPFSPYVINPSFLDSEEFPVGLTRSLEEDFEALGLLQTNLQTNRLEKAPLLPVRFPAGP
jgi:hypothetical protein